jgi:hypothetical protein
LGLVFLQHWQALAALISAVLGGVSLLYAEDSSVHAESNSIKLGCGIVAAVIHFLSIVLSLSMASEAREVVYVTPKSTTEADATVLAWMQSLPVASIRWECYHYETRTSTDSKGRRHTRRVKVTTASGAEPVPVMSAVDLSSEWHAPTVASLLGLDERWATVMHTKLEVWPVDERSAAFLNAMELSVRAENQGRDTHYGQHTSYAIACGLPSSLTLTANTAGRPCWVSVPVYVLAVLLGVSYIFNTLLHVYAAGDAFMTVRKFATYGIVDPEVGAGQVAGGAQFGGEGQFGVAAGADRFVSATPGATGATVFVATHTPSPLPGGADSGTLMGGEKNVAEVAL